MVLFLTIKMKAPDQDGWGNVLKYLRGIVYTKLVLSVDSLNIIQWWVDTHYGVSWGLKCHKGMMMRGGIFWRTRDML